MKKLFLDHGVQVAGGMALSDGSIGGQFQSFCYTDPADRALVKSAAELAARHFDEVIQDDFFFVTTKKDSDMQRGFGRWDAIVGNRVSFAAHLPPHSYAVFALEDGHGSASQTIR